MKGFNFGSSLSPTQKPPTPQQQLTDIRSILPPPPTVYLRRPPSNRSDNNIYITQESIPKQVKRIISEAQHNESISILDLLVLLRRGKELTKHNKDRLNNGILCCYLGIMYYKTGLLEEAFQEFLIADNAIKEHIDVKRLSKHMQSSETEESSTSLLFECKWLKIRGRIHLQLCILLSEIERHELALKHAKMGIKIFYEVSINYLLIVRGAVLNKMTNRQHSILKSSFQKSNNILSALHKLATVLQDINPQYLSKPKITQLESQNAQFQSLNTTIDEVNIQQLTKEVISRSKWVLENKILNQVQMELFDKIDYLEVEDIKSSHVIDVVVFLVVGFYCLSTESRFLEKEDRVSMYGHVLESQNWLSRALELAYVFLPAEAPILGQVYSVHDKFYGLGKQPIPEDEEIGGHIKFLKQMRKVSSIYDKKALSLCVPILIRTNQPSSFSPEKQPYSSVSSSKHVKMRSLTIDLNLNRLKNNSKRNSLQKIYKKNRGRLLKPSKGSSSLEYRDDTPKFEQQKLRPLSTQVGLSKLTRLPNPRIDLDTTSINLLTSHPTRSFDDKLISSQQMDGEKQKRLGLLNNRKVILKLIPGEKKFKESTVNKRNIYHIKRRGMGIKEMELSQL